MELQTTVQVLFQKTQAAAAEVLDQPVSHPTQGASPLHQLKETMVATVRQHQEHQVRAVAVAQRLSAVTAVQLLAEAAEQEQRQRHLQAAQ